MRRPSNVVDRRRGGTINGQGGRAHVSTATSVVPSANSDSLLPASINNTNHEGGSTPSDMPTSQSARQRRPRGMSRGIRAPASLALRQVVKLGQSTIITKEARNKVGVIFRTHITGPWDKWKEVPDDVRDGCFQEFCGYFKFNEGEEDKGHRIFLQHAQTNYPKWLAQARNQAIKKAGTTRLTLAAKQYPPDYMRRDLWEKFVDGWLKGNSWLNKSAKAKKSREASTLIHTGGSAPFEQHRLELEEQNDGRAPSVLEVFNKVYKKKGTEEYTTPRAQQISADYHDAVHVENDEPENENSLFPADHDDYAIWGRVCGGYVKNRAVGFGPRQSVKALLRASHQNACSSSASAATPLSSQSINEDFVERTVEACLARRDTANPSSETSREVDEQRMRSMMMNIFQTQMPMIVANCIASLSNNMCVPQSVQGNQSVRPHPQGFPRAQEHGADQNSSHM